MIDPETNEVWVDDMWGESPQWQHDCEGCQFQGTFKGYDLYTCLDSFLARFGNDGPNYLSTFSMASIFEAILVRGWAHSRKPCPGCAEPCGQCDQEALD